MAFDYSTPATSPTDIQGDTLPSKTNGDVPVMQDLQTPEQAEIFNAIDQVRALGIGHKIALPQLIVVGDQSSGKSSVLEAISHVKFPVNEGTCTRFPIEVIMRHSDEVSASVELHPGSDDPTPEHQNFLKKFRADDTTLDAVPRLINEARDYMNLGSGGFTSDVLRLQISGPKCQHLTLVDLPGLIHNPGKGRSIEDKILVNNLVERYMSQPRSIILTVVSAISEEQMQEVLRLADKCDPNGERTMGIITKPDRSKPGSQSQNHWLACARGDEGSFRLGWHVLRNADFDDRGREGFDRDALERAFFSEGPWSQLMPEKRGVESLRSRLSKCLLSLIKAELPGVIREIEASKTSNEESLKRLGDSRSTTAEQRKYLIGIGGIYHTLVKDAAAGHYNHPFFTASDDGKRKLRTLMRHWGETFHQTMHEEGHTYDVVWEQPQHNLTGISDFRGSPLMDLIKRTLDSTRGWELPGSFNPLIITPIFQRMSSKWIALAQEYAEDVYENCRLFMKILLSEHCELDVCTRILREVIDDEMEERLRQVRLKIEELSSPYTKGQVFTFNTRFEQVQRSLHKMLALDTTGPRWSLVNRDNDLLASEQVFVRAQAFYQVALETFVDNVAMIAVENCLISGLEDVFSVERIATMENDEIAAIASELPENVSKRAFMQKLQRDLNAALRTCKQYEGFGRPRESRRRNATPRPIPESKPSLSTTFSNLKVTSPTLVAEPFTQKDPKSSVWVEAKLRLPTTPSRSTGAGSATTSPSRSSLPLHSRSTSATTMASADYITRMSSNGPTRAAADQRKEAPVDQSSTPTPGSRSGSQENTARASPENRGNYREPAVYDADDTDVEP